jgi:hypothetical protein
MHGSCLESGERERERDYSSIIFLPWSIRISTHGKTSDEETPVPERPQSTVSQVVLRYQRTKFLQSERHEQSENRDLRLDQ